jgi:hypothetical protein
MSAGAATPPTFFAEASLRAAHLYDCSTTKRAPSSCISGL